ncbi:hypothetical protein EJ08DRAFT_639870 [Tothia fuscella]|uniref:Golgi apyrase n=1 Tax=Tothia fuscella TaxID=1048955 RepID=A0A9P4TUZ2_9PEZI|nr:hypothetical protein EJ08DRAFT_639870 [Tothia fuscella]
MGTWRYGVILDAGSSGTRVYVYKWLNPARARKDAIPEQLHTLPELVTKKKWTLKTHPGVSTFGTNPSEVGEKHLAPLLNHALSHVPVDAVADTPFFLLATAGMRLLPEHQRARLLQEICSYTRETTKFQLPDCDLHVQVIPGETEGLYGWIAANYLLGGFDNPQDHDHGKGHHTYGFLDMGGASAQIAFAPNATEAEKHANDLKLLRLRTIDGVGEEYKVFVTTWLGYGANEARRRYITALQDAVGESSKELPDPCLPSGLHLTLAGKPVPAGHENDPHLLGTGKFKECLSQTYPLLEKDKPCLDEPCLVGGTHVPAIDFDVNHFVGVSEYWHTTHEIFEMDHLDKAYDFKTYQSRVSEFCSQPWEDIEAGIKSMKWGKKVDETTAEEVCFKASWLINMLHDGIGIPRVGLEMKSGGKNTTQHLISSAKSKGFLDPFQAINKIEGTEVSWTLGKMVLYASSQVPPAEDTMAVGFGSNTPGVATPTDFQYPGGKQFDTPDDLTNMTPDAEVADQQDWHDKLFQDSPKRVPGFLLFLLILAVATFLILGRERRNALYTKLRSIFGLGPCRRKRGPTSTARFGKYDRVVVDDPEAAVSSANEFELQAPYPHDFDSGDEHSDDTEGTAGKASGWATPTLHNTTPGTGLESSPSKRGYFGDASGLGLGPAWTAGLMSRVDSRERLVPGRSRNASPTRRSPNLGLGSFVKESVD